MVVLSLLKNWLLRRKARQAEKLASERKPFGRAFRPALETLEDRLPPGNLLAMSALPSAAKTASVGQVVVQQTPLKVQPPPSQPNAFGSTFTQSTATSSGSAAFDPSVQFVGIVPGEIQPDPFLSSGTTL